MTEKDSSLLQHKRLMLLRPHSVDIPLRVSTEICDLPADFLDTPKTAHQRRDQFVNSHTNSKYFSLPADSNLKPAAKDSVGSNRNNGRPTIFRTSSSASLQGDSFVSSSVPIIPSGEPWKKTLQWISALLERKGTPAPMPLDDSMDFGLQPSLSQKDKIINAESSSFETKNGSADKKNRNNLQLEIDTVIERVDANADAKVETRTAVYKKRWYLLLLFSLSAMLWNAVWSTWGPIAQSAKDVYHWSDSDIAMFIWLGNIPFLLTMFPCSYLMDVKGMRTAMIVACGFMFLGTGFRCVPSDVTTATWLIRIGQFLNGMAGTIPNSAPALLSGLWFPPNQRASATAISTVAGYMGASVSFVIGPLLVPQPNDLLPVNNTDDLLSVDLDVFDIGNMTNVTTYNAQKEGIMHILYAEFAVAGLLLLLVLIYFPSKPPLPPSVSASMPREKYIPGLKMLVRNKQFWVCAMAFSVPAGVYEAWQVILDVILDDKGVSQQTAGWLDFYATVGGCVSGLLVCRFADFFTRQMKLFLLVFYFFAAVSILWFTLVVFDILPFDRVSMYAAIIIGGVFLDGGGPLFFELTIEVSYPVGEGVTSGFTQMLCAAAGIVFLSVVQVESLGKEWINWYFFGCVAMAIPPLFFISTTFGRADLDDADEEEDEVAGEVVSADTDEKTYLFGSSHV
ncbi:unnamed protein product [Candidula unifasciata]|uniref:Uncharacterized protein n=1 Tax=Candidula unifasciata TaxID=100452 RepID=A0A8S3ZVL6_9EUPU|nr:unnamed protein product [Candidula unifasciata]